jgi:hypothetical protein
MQHLSGGCLCGGIRCSAGTEPAFTAVCHCRNCQKQMGTAASVIVGLPAGSFKLTGLPRTFHDTGDSGEVVHRRFCPECGSPFLTDAEAVASPTFREAGALDDAGWLGPAMEIWCDRAPPWLPHVDKARKFAKGPA